MNTYIVQRVRVVVETIKVYGENEDKAYSNLSKGIYVHLREESTRVPMKEILEKEQTNE